MFVTVHSQPVLFYTVCNYVYGMPSYRIVDVRFINLLLQTLSRKLDREYTESPLCSLTLRKTN